MFKKSPLLTGIAGELQSVTSRLGHTFTWRGFLERADDELLLALREAFRFDDGIRDQILLATCAEGYNGMGQLRGKNDRLKDSTVRYAYHTIAVIDFCMGLIEYPVLNERRSQGQVAVPIQYSYKHLTPPSGKRYRRPLSPEETKQAKAVCLARIASTYREIPNKRSMTYIADNYDELSPYFSSIVLHEDISLPFLESLVETKPAHALISGML